MLVKNTLINPFACWRVALSDKTAVWSWVTLFGSGFANWWSTASVPEIATVFGVVVGMIGVIHGIWHKERVLKHKRSASDDVGEHY